MQGTPHRWATDSGHPGADRLWITTGNTEVLPEASVPDAPPDLLRETRDVGTMTARPERRTQPVSGRGRPVAGSGDLGGTGGWPACGQEGEGQESGVQGSQPPADADDGVPRAPWTVHGFGGRKAPVGPAGGQPGLEPGVEADRRQGVDGTPGL